MKNNAIATFIFAIIVLAGGVMGYYKAHSLPSLIMGATFAVLLSVSAFAMLRNWVLGYVSAIGLTLVLGAFFFNRYLVTQSFMPAGLMTILSMVLIIILIVQRPVVKNGK
jgi:uncharacterized membrane protein (UPF0136 family)